MAKKFTPKRKATKDQMGSGLEALLGGNRLDKAMKESPKETIATLSKDFSFIPISKINAHPDQPRQHFEEAPLAELAESIKIHGIIQPMTVRHMGDGTYQIISGERRFRASQRAGLTEVPAFIRTADDQTLLEMALIENIQRQDLNPIEVAYSYYRLKEDFELTQSEVADRVGKPRATVAGYLGILNTSPKVQEAIKKNEISIGIAKTFSNIKDVSLQEEFLKDILKNPSWSVRKIEEEAKTYKAKSPVHKSAKPARVENSDFKVVKEAFKDFFETKQVTVSSDGKSAMSGSITIKFANKEQLEQLYKCLEP